MLGWRQLTEGCLLKEFGLENTDKFIRLDHFLKTRSAVESGGQAKVIIQSGDVMVNGEVDTRRGKKLRMGDVVDFNGETMAVEEDDLR